MDRTSVTTFSFGVNDVEVPLWFSKSQNPDLLFLASFFSSLTLSCFVGLSTTWRPSSRSSLSLLLARCPPFPHLLLRKPLEDANFDRSHFDSVILDASASSLSVYKTTRSSLFSFCLKGFFVETTDFSSPSPLVPLSLSQRSFPAFKLSLL